ncbi:uncharacterized protein An05g01190 [Aspergillus niger]|uniref:Contig An05c0040, genomic contig n=2 Tax=Aspergillus niger TaxID=5061 RepID=A2QKS1_ASPNC|nr:uncharacterized protein An05g01190 [Aspergillus niger]CAK39154.1 unnamed protein product [Aspergillus niger]
MRQQDWLPENIVPQNNAIYNDSEALYMEMGELVQQTEVIQSRCCP